MRNNVVKSDGDDAADPAGITMSLYNMTKLVHNMNVHECTIIFKRVGIHIPQTSTRGHHDSTLGRTSIRGLQIIEEKVIPLH